MVGRWPLARVVGQLSFGDFLARVDLDQGNGSAGNVNLVPPQSWELNFEAKKDLGAWGTSTVKLYGKRYQDYIEWIPLPGGVESRGNIDTATIYGTAEQCKEQLAIFEGADCPRVELVMEPAGLDIEQLEALASITTKV